jgi:hypothetical protein
MMDKTVLVKRANIVLAWHTLFDELELCPETVGAQRLAPDSMVKSIPQF